MHVCVTLHGFRNYSKALFRRYIACMRYFARFLELLEGSFSSLYCMYALLCKVLEIIGRLFFVAVMHVCATLQGSRNYWKALFRRYIACMRYFARFWELVEGMDSSLYCGNASLCRLPGPPKTLKRLSGGLLVKYGSHSETNRGSQVDMPKGTALQGS